MNKPGLDLNQADALKQMRWMNDVSRAIILAEDADQAIEKVLQLICELVGAEAGRAVILIVENGKSPPRSIADSEAGGDTPSNLEFKPDASITIPVFGMPGVRLEFCLPGERNFPVEFDAYIPEISQQLSTRIERHLTIEKLQQSEEHLRLLVESVKDIAFYTMDVDGNITSWNRGAEKIKGYSQQEAIGKNFSLFSSPEDIAANKPQQILEIARQEGRYEGEVCEIRKDGSTFWADVVVFPIYNSEGSLQGYTRITRDLTRRKQIEAEMRQNQAYYEAEMAELRRKLMQGRESERLHMAQELHDGPIQELYGLIFSLDVIGGKIRSPYAIEQLQDAKNQLQAVVSTLRGMIGDLRPPTLAPFGLEKSIRSYIQGFREAHPELQIEMDLDSDRRTLPEDVRLALYRVFQSSLANIVRHAEASQVWIRLKLEEEQVWMEIADNGKGFEVPERWIKLARSGHLGLVGARERAEAVGGSFWVKSAPGEGSLVRVSIPRTNRDSEDQSG